MMNISHSRKSLARRDALDMSSCGYWIAAAIDDKDSTTGKSYFDVKCHGDCKGWELLSEICDINNFDTPGLRTLIDMAREYEEDDTPDLVGVLVQMRNGATSEN